jgi:hypothetical protein
MTATIKILQPGDDHVLMNVAEGVFDYPVDAKLTREFLEDPRHHIAVAIVGFASGVHYVHPSSTTSSDFRSRLGARRSRRQVRALATPAN